MATNSNLFAKKLLISRIVLKKRDADTLIMKKTFKKSGEFQSIVLFIHLTQTYLLPCPAASF